MTLQIKRLIAVFFICLISLFSKATDYYVNNSTTVGDVYTTATGSNTTGDGSAGNPYATISHVINTIGLSSGDNVYIDAGIYDQTDIQLVINTANIDFIGAGSGYTLFDNSGSGGTQEYFMQINANNVTLTGFTITGYDYEPGGKGKAITVSGATGVVLDDIATVDNRENGDAAVFILSNSTVSILNAISSCNQTSYGGGYQIEGSNIDVLFDNCIIADNRKTAYWGGGILIMGSSGGSSNITVTVQNTSINQNRAVRGGGIYISGATLNVSNSCFDGNVKNGSNDSGGALYVGYNATVTLNQCSFTNNTANASSADGGAIGVYAQNSTVSIQQCYFDGNSANDDGNAIFVDRAFSSGSAVVTTNESIFNSGQNVFRKSDGSLTITNSGTRQVDSGSSSINGNDIAQSLGVPTTSCPTISNPCFVSALPVELIDFTSTCLDENAIQFDWSTASEAQNDFFFISRLSESNEWIEVATKDAIGNSQTVNNYSLKIPNGRSGYYQISQQDLDGRVEDLKVVYATAECYTSTDIQAIYDPSNNSLKLIYSSDENSTLNATIISSTGQVIAQQELNFDLGQEQQAIHIQNHIASGIYHIIITGNKAMLSTRVSIVR